jgi:hypothetical protein
MASSRKSIEYGFDMQTDLQRQRIESDLLAIGNPDSVKMQTALEVALAVVAA